MPPSNWDEIEEVFQAALELPAGERPSWVVARCGTDEVLRREVESLLAAESESENFLRRPDFLRAVGTLLGDDGQADRAGQQLGPFRILREVGRGGMGVVYEAAREDGEFRQRVAVKVVKRGLDTDDILRRFRHERQILASLHHPNIAAVFDGGTTPDGLPYFVMEYVEGTTLLQYCDEYGLLTDERLRLFRNVCGAVQHAHQNLVVHRDLKPSNILVTREGEVKLLDFGVAKLLHPESEDAWLTGTRGPGLMTPEYASPEQVRGLHVTTATDVYSLGVVLYELLTGARPYRLKDASPEEVSRAICDSQPSKPSEALRDGQAREGTDSVSSSSGPAAHTRERVSRSHLKGDLDNIVLKALRKEPERRYGSVGQLSEDIGRHLKGLPVAARRDTFAYRATKFVGRNRVAVSAAALVAVAIIAGLIVALWQADAARRQRDLAQHERVRAERINTFLQRMLSFSNQSITSVSPVAQSRDVTVNEMLDEITPQVEAELADQPEVRAQVLRTIGSAYASQGQYEEAEKNLRAALDAQTRLYGEESAEAAATMLELGVLSYRQSKLDEANRVLEKAVAFYRKQRQANSPDYNAAKLALASDYLGVVKFYQGDTKASLALMNEALQISSGARLQGGERGVLTFNKSDLGAILVTLGDVEKGEPLLREAEAEYRQASSQPRWELGVTLMQLGAAALSRDQPDEAQKYLLESEQILRHTLGDKNVYLSGNLVGQAFAFSQKHELPAAEEKARAALAMCQAFSPDNKLPQVMPMWTLADVLTRAGRVREGEDYYRQALTIDEEQTTKNYPFIAQLKIRLSQSLLAQNRLPEAERVALEARDDVMRNLGEQHPLLKAATDLLIKIYERQGRYDLAQSLR